MSIFPFSLFFKKKQTKLELPDTILVKRLKELSQQSNLLIFKDINIYHHKESYHIALIVIDNLRGIYLFETKEWTFQELESATIQKANSQENSANTLAFENTHAIIRKKFNELTHSDGVPIFNYLLMENLTTDEYKHLRDSFKELLPEKKIIFSDSHQKEIIEKLHAIPNEQEKAFSNDAVVGTLFIQYAILDRNQNIHLATSKQRDFIDIELQNIHHIQGEHSSGKSSIILLKSIVTLLQDSTQKIVIIKPTLLACDFLKKRLLEIIEHGIIEINLSAIEIVTPLELINKHLSKLNKKQLDRLIIDDKLLKKSFFAANIIFCDDAHLLQQEFVHYLKNLQKKEKLVLVNDLERAEDEPLLELTQSFSPQERKITFHKTNPHAKAMQLIAALLRDDTERIVVVSNTLSREKLTEDLENFIKEPVGILQSDRPLIKQNLNKLLLCGYEDINEIEVAHIILMDLGFLSKNEIEYAFHLSTNSVDILYEEDSQEIISLRNADEQSN
jgi:hypothetical protein